MMTFILVKKLGEEAKENRKDFKLFAKAKVAVSSELSLKKNCNKFNLIE